MTGRTPSRPRSRRSIPEGGGYLVEPGITNPNVLGDSSFLLGQQSQGAPRQVENPVPTILTDGAISLVKPLVVEYYGESDSREVDQPLSCVMPVNHHGLASPILVEYYGKGNGADIDLPVPTLTTKERHGLANPLLIDVNHGYTQQGEAGDGIRSQSVEAPLGTVTTKRGLGLVNPTVDVQAYIVPNFGERNGQDPRVHAIDNPTPTVTSRGAGSLVLPSLEQLESSQIDPRRVVVVNGHPFLLDIRFRMLQNTELARAMGFDDEETQYEFVGNIGEVTKQIGNAVPVNLAAALVAAILVPGMDS